MGHATLRLGHAEPIEEGREAGPFLGLVDRFQVAPEEWHTGANKRCRQVERRLTTVGDDRRERW